MENFPVIGVCGPAKSGKDMVADWFCENHGFQKVAFADPMKRFAREVFQADYETLWGSSQLREKPKTYSDQEWLEVMGRFNYNANALIINEVVEDSKVPAYLSLMEWLSSMRRSHQEQGHLTMREVLQTLGTEWGRRKVNELLWVRYLYTKVAPKLASGDWQYSQEKGLVYEGANRSTPKPKGIIIPDHRFLNEIQGTRQFGGFTLRIRRLALEKEGVTGNVGIENHQSEVEMRDIPDSEFNLVLELGEGPENVYPALEKLFEEKPWDKVSTTSGTEKESPSDTA